MPIQEVQVPLDQQPKCSTYPKPLWITCNPDPESWVRKFIDWWVDENGYIIPERDGVIRYCFMDGDTPDSIYWGDTREEVYEQCNGIIDSLWKDSYEELGYTKLEMFIKSATSSVQTYQRTLSLSPPMHHISPTLPSRMRNSVCETWRLTGTGKLPAMT